MQASRTLQEANGVPLVSKKANWKQQHCDPCCPPLHPCKHLPGSQHPCRSLGTTAIDQCNTTTPAPVTTVAASHSNLANIAGRDTHSSQVSVIQAWSALSSRIKSQIWEILLLTNLALTAALLGQRNYYQVHQRI